MSISQGKSTQWPGVLDLFSKFKISWLNFYGFESAIYTLIKELADSDNHRILGLNSGKIERLSDLQTHQLRILTLSTTVAIHLLLDDFG